jgi:cell wall-associated NlpC family hydrolase
MKTSDLTDLIGKKFNYGGRGPMEYDCYGLVMEIYRRSGIYLPDFGSSPSAPWLHRMISEGKKLFLELPKPEPFCLVTFAIRPPFTTHIGVVLEDSYRFIHIMTKTEVTIERLDSPLWKKKITGYFVPFERTQTKTV